MSEVRPAVGVHWMKKARTFLVKGRASAKGTEI